MRKQLIVVMVLLLVGVATMASANWLGDLLKADIDPRQDQVKINNNLVQSSITVTNATDGASINVDDCNVVEVDTSSANCTLQSFANGVDGQIVHVVVVDTTNNAIMKYQNGTGQQFNLSGGNDETEAGFGGWSFYCNGTEWLEIDQ